MNQLGITDKYYLMEAISEAALKRRIDYTGLTLAVFAEAEKGDAVARDILQSVGVSCAQAVAGAIMNMDFDEPVEVVLAGSVWVKGASPIMIKAFSDEIARHVNKQFRILTLQVPPATGAVIWALELAGGVFPDYEKRRQIIETVSAHLEAEA